MITVLFLSVTCAYFANNPAFIVREWFHGPDCREIGFRESLEAL